MSRMQPPHNPVAGDGRIDPKAHDRNFPVASRLLPRAWREPILDFYSYVRGLDEISDAPGLAPAEKQTQLSAVREAVHQPTGMVPGWAAGYARLIATGRLSSEHGDALWWAFWQDTEKTRYRTIDEVLDYCRISAAPVGRAVLELAAEAEADLAASDAICMALQLINHLQDVKSDYLERSRSYIPQAWLEAEDVEESEFTEAQMSASLRRVADRWLDVVDGLLRHGRELPESIGSWRLRLEIELILFFAETLARRLRRQDPLAGPVELTVGDKIRSVAKLTYGVHSRSQRRGSSFFLPMLLMRREKREAMRALYGFCRAADDAVDDAPSPEVASANLRVWQEEIDRIYRGERPIKPLARKLAVAIGRFGMEKPVFDDMLEGLRRDCQPGRRIGNWAELQDYCYRVAGCVGLQAMRIFQVTGERADAFAVALGQALQLTNILRDIEEDGLAGRCYVPTDWLETAGLAYVKPQGFARHQERLQGVRDRLIAEAEEAFARADRLAKELPSRPLLPALLMRDIYALYLKRLRERPRHLFTRRLKSEELATLFRKARHYRRGSS